MSNAKHFFCQLQKLLESFRPRFGSFGITYLPSSTFPLRDSLGQPSDFPFFTSAHSHSTWQEKTRQRSVGSNVCSNHSIVHVCMVLHTEANNKEYRQRPLHFPSAHEEKELSAALFVTTPPRHITREGHVFSYMYLSFPSRRI